MKINFHCKVKFVTYIFLEGCNISLKYILKNSILFLVKPSFHFTLRTTEMPEFFPQTLITALP